MRGDEVDARPGAAPFAVETVARRQQARGERGRRRLAAPEIAHRVAKLVVPFRPARRKAPDLVAAGPVVPWLPGRGLPADLVSAGPVVPWLGDQFYRRQQ